MGRGDQSLLHVLFSNIVVFLTLMVTFKIQFIVVFNIFIVTMEPPQLGGGLLYRQLNNPDGSMKLRAKCGSPYKFIIHFILLHTLSDKISRFHFLKSLLHVSFMRLSFVMVNLVRR